MLKLGHVSALAHFQCAKRASESRVSTKRLCANISSFKNPPLCYGVEITLINKITNK